MRLLLILVAIIASPAALADASLASGDAWTIYATANGQALQAILTAIKGIVQDSSYLTLLTFVSILAFIGFAIMAALDVKKIEQFMGVLVAILIVSEFAIRQTSDVIIEDPFYGTVYTVQDVPAGVAVPISMISTVGQEVTEMIESYFSTPSALKISTTGTINMASSLIQDASQMKIRDPHITASMAAFSQDCILPSIAQGRLTGAGIVEATQLFGASGILKNINPSLLTTVYGKESSGPTSVVTHCGSASGGASGATITYENYFGGTTVTADNAYDYLSQLIEIGAPYQLAQGRGVAYGTPAYNWIETSISSAQTYLSDGAVTVSGGDSIRQAAAANLLTDGLSTAVAQSGDSALTSTVALAQATKAQDSNWVMAAAIFNDISGYIFSLLQALMIGLMPLFIIAAFVPGTKMKILITVGQVFIWLALWQPTFAILNFIITEYSQGPFGGAFTDANYTMSTAPIISETTNRFIAAAGFMGASIPMITWGIVKGGMALTSFVGGAMGGSFASAAANMASTGNVSLGNQSYDNYSANSTNASGPTNLGVAGPVTSTPSVGSGQVDAQGGGFSFTRDGEKVSRTYDQAKQSAEKLAEQQSVAGQEKMQSGRTAIDAALKSSTTTSTTTGNESAEVGGGTTNTETLSEDQAASIVQQARDDLQKTTEGMTQEQASAKIAATMQASPQLRGIWDKAKGALGWGGDSDGNTRGGGGNPTGVNMAVRGGNERSLTGSTTERGSETTAAGTTASDSSGVSKKSGTTDTDSYMAKASLAKAIMQANGQTDTEQYQQLEAATQEYTEGRQLVASAEESLTETSRLSGSAGFQSLDDLMGAVGTLEKQANRFADDGISVDGEGSSIDQLRQRTGDIARQTGFNDPDKSRKELDSKVGKATAGDVDTTGTENASERLAGIQGQTGDVGTDNSYASVISDKNQSYEDYDSKLAAIQEERKEKGLEVDPAVKEARENAKALQDEGLWDISRQYDLMNKGDVAMLGGVLAASGVSAMLENAGLAKGTEKATDLARLSHDEIKKGSGLGDQIKSKFDKAVGAVQEWKDGLKNKASSVSSLWDNVKNADEGDIKKFLSNDKVQDQLGKVMGEGWVEKQAAKVAAGTMAAGTGIGAVVTGALYAETGYSILQGAEALNTAFNQYRNGEDIDLSSLVTGSNESSTPVTSTYQAGAGRDFPQRPETEATSPNATTVPANASTAAGQPAGQASAAGSQEVPAQTTVGGVSQSSSDAPVNGANAATTADQPAGPASGDGSQEVTTQTNVENNASGQLQGVDSPLNTDGLTNRGVTDARPNYTPEQFNGIVNNMESGAVQEWARSEQANLMQSGLLNNSPNGDGTVLESLANGSMSKQEALDSGLVSEADFTRLHSEIPGMREN
jgi:hypothetical protein